MESRFSYNVSINYDPSLDAFTRVDDEELADLLESFKSNLYNNLLERQQYDLDLFNEIILEKWEFKTVIKSNLKRSLPLNLVDKIPYQIFHIISLPDFELFKIQQSVSFIGSLRNGPERTYYESTNSSLSVGTHGENFTDLIVLWKSLRDKKFKLLIQILRRLNLANDLRVNRMTGGRYDLEIKPNEKSPFSSLSDVGFGLSQFLPIVVADIEKGSQSTLFIAQPETHLHPSAQADYCDYIVESILDNDKQYFIETHSEYFLNRLRLKVVDGTLSSTDFKVYYLTNDGNDTTIHDIIFLKNGAISGAPKQFFDTYLMDTMDIAINSI